MQADYKIRPTCDNDRLWMPSFITEHWGAEYIVVHGVMYHPDRLPGFVAEDNRGYVVGLATYVVETQACELVTLNAVQQGVGIGTALLEKVIAVAKQAGCIRVWLITTNDNIDALAFYQKRHLHLVAVNRDALEVSRRLKPSIPLVAPNGIPIRDELELELLLSDQHYNFL